MSDPTAARNEHKHADLVQTASAAPPVPNPFAQSANVVITVPESVDVRLVDASTLGDYEVWSLAASILSSAVVGFLVAFFQASPPARSQYLASTLTFAVLLIIAVLMAAAKRRRLVQKTRRLRYKVGEQLQDQPEQ